MSHIPSTSRKQSMPPFKVATIDLSMPTEPSNNAPAPNPLSKSEQTELDRTLCRLQESFREFWAAWPVARRNPTQIGRELGIDSTTCRRLSTIARARYEPTAILESLPGPRTLRALLDAAEQADSPVPEQVLAAFRAAVDSFDEFLLASSGSLSKLKRRLATPRAAQAPTSSADGLADPDPQQSLYNAARKINKKHSLASTSITLYDKVGVADDDVRCVTIGGMHSFVAAPDAVPTIMGEFPTLTETFVDAPTSKSAGSDMPMDNSWQRSPLVLEDFTSADRKVFQINSSPDFALQALEIKRSNSPSDFYLYASFPLSETNGETWLMVSVPTEMLIFDLYLHKSVARRCLVSVDIHLWHPNFANDPHAKWHTRMPQTPALIQLGEGIAKSASPFNPRQTELTVELFKRADANPDDYIGFRCEERFPIWRTGYRYGLDFDDSTQG